MSLPPSPSPSLGVSPVPLDRNAVLFAVGDFDIQHFFPDGLAPFHPATHRKDCRRMPRDEWRALLLERRPRVLVSSWSTPPLEDDLIASGGGSVEYLCHVTGSVRKIVTDVMIQRGLLVSNWGSTIAPQAAEHALALVLGVLRNAGVWSRFLNTPPAARHKVTLATRTLFGRKVGLYGFGTIARSLLPLLVPFGVSLTAFSAGVPKTFFREHGVEPAADLADLARSSEVLIVCESLTPATRDSIDAAVLSALPEGAVMVNVGRGALVRETDLLVALAERRLRFASDVLVEDPVPTDSPFLANPEVIISPHIAGPTHDRYSACGAAALANLRRFFAGQQLQGLVTAEIYRRST